MMCPGGCRLPCGIATKMVVMGEHRGRFPGFLGGCTSRYPSAAEFRTAALL
jgi:hypothetical protein